MLEIQVSGVEGDRRTLVLELWDGLLGADPVLGDRSRWETYGNYMGTTGIWEYMG